jgi:hypothetical protein
MNFYLLLQGAELQQVWRALSSLQQKCQQQLWMINCNKKWQLLSRQPL